MPAPERSWRARTAARIGRPTRRRRLLVALASVCAVLAVVFAIGGEGAQGQPASGSSAIAAGDDQDAATVARGKQLFQEGCSSCHGLEGRGVAGVAPDLRGVGAQAADFYLSTGRMPLSDPGDQPVRAEPRYPPDEIDAIVAYVGSLGGPPIPSVDLADGSLAEGFDAFTQHCAGCHQAVARGGIVTGAFAPDLGEASPTQVVEAIRVGPYLMPNFSRRVIDDRAANSIARYVELTKDPVDDGGWAIGNLGPIPEGMVAWLLAIAVLLIVARLIGERNHGDERTQKMGGSDQDTT